MENSAPNECELALENVFRFRLVAQPGELLPTTVTLGRGGDCGVDEDVSAPTARLAAVRRLTAAWTNCRTQLMQQQGKFAPKKSPVLLLEQLAEEEEEESDEREEQEKSDIIVESPVIHEREENGNIMQKRQEEEEEKDADELIVRILP